MARSKPEDPGSALRNVTHAQRHEIEFKERQRLSRRLWKIERALEVLEEKMRELWEDEPS